MIKLKTHGCTNYKSTNNPKSFFLNRYYTNKAKSKLTCSLCFLVKLSLGYKFNVEMEKKLNKKFLILNYTIQKW